MASQGSLFSEAVSQLQESLLEHKKNDPAWKIWKKNNRDKVNATARRYRENHKELCRQRDRRWKKEHPEIIRIFQKKNRKRATILAKVRYDKNPEKNRKASRDWYWKHKDKATAHHRRWMRDNKEIVKTHLALRRGRKMKAAGKYTTKNWLDRVLFYGWRCFYCRITLTPTTLTRDHRIPLARGGSNWASNLVPACRRCNYSKGPRKFPKLQMAGA